MLFLNRARVSVINVAIVTPSAFNSALMQFKINDLFIKILAASWIITFSVSGEHASNPRKDDSFLELPPSIILSLGYKPLTLSIYFFSTTIIISSIISQSWNASIE